MSSLLSPDEFTSTMGGTGLRQRRPTRGDPLFPTHRRARGSRVVWPRDGRNANTDLAGRPVAGLLVDGSPCLCVSLPGRGIVAAFFRIVLYWILHSISAPFCVRVREILVVYAGKLEIRPELRRPHIHELTTHSHVGSGMRPAHRRYGCAHNIGTIHLRCSAKTFRGSPRVPSSWRCQNVAGCADASRQKRRVCEGRFTDHKRPNGRPALLSEGGLLFGIEETSALGFARILSLRLQLRPVTMATNGIRRQSRCEVFFIFILIITSTVS